MTRKSALYTALGELAIGVALIVLGPGVGFKSGGWCLLLAGVVLLTATLTLRKYMK